MLQLHPFYFRDVSELKLLCLSSTSSNLYAINAISQLLSDRGDNIDLVVIAGDITNMETNEGQSTEHLSALEGAMSGTLASVENVHARVIYVPGRTDPPRVLMQPAPRLTQHSINIHNRCVRIAENLVVAGLGGYMGSADTSDIDDCKEQMEDLIHDRLVSLMKPQRREVPCGYPVDGFSAAATRATTMPLSDVVMDDDNVILLSYLGPEGLGTTLQLSLDHSSPVSSENSSLSMRRVLCLEELQRSLMLHVHGGNPASLGNTSVGNVTVLNPGSARDGNFCLVDLLLCPITKKWQVKTVEQIRLGRNYTEPIIKRDQRPRSC